MKKLKCVVYIELSIMPFVAQNSNVINKPDFGMQVVNDKFEMIVLRFVQETSATIVSIF